MVRGYSNHFAVDKLCAIKELEMLDYPVDRTYKKNLQDHANALQYKAEQKKIEEIDDSWYEESDETFAYIAGYTSGGAPYGVTWEEWGQNDAEKNSE